MAVESVLAQVVAICGGIAGVNESSTQGLDDLAVIRTPLCLVAAGEPQSQRLTGGAGGTLEARYAVTITLVLGGPEMMVRRALALAAGFFDSFRTAFWGDPTLGGTCWQSELSDGVTNLGSYRARKTPPQVVWRLLVREMVAADGGAGAGLVAGPGAYIAIGAPGAESDISAACSAAHYAETTAEHDNTPYGAAAASMTPGLASGQVTLYGKWDAASNVLLAGLRRVAGQNIVLGPAGSGAGKAKISAVGYLRDYAVEADGSGGAVGWRAFFRVTSAFSFETF